MSRSVVVIAPRARSMIHGAKPSLVAISRPADFPGAPTRRIYVGARVSSSKPIDPLSTDCVLAPYTFNASRCVEATTIAPMDRK